MILGSAATHLIKGAAGTFTLGRLRFLPFLAFLGFAGGVCSQGRSSKASGCSYHAEKVRRGFDQSRFLGVTHGGEARGRRPSAQGKSNFSVYPAVAKGVTE